jgi:hypothetical protein
VRRYDGFQGHDTGYSISEFATRHPGSAASELNVDGFAVANCFHSVPNALVASGADDEAVIMIVGVGAEFDYSCYGYIAMGAQVIHCVG